MNERIRELVKEAGLTLVPNSKPIIYQGPISELEKFAELIVRECIDNVKVWEKDSRNHISYMLKRQYGVEE